MIRPKQQDDINSLFLDQKDATRTMQSWGYFFLQLALLRATRKLPINAGVHHRNSLLCLASAT
jgi:hypothetical protein